MLDLHCYLLSHLPLQIYIRNMPALQPAEKYRESQAIHTIGLVYIKQSGSSSMEPYVSQGNQVRNESWLAYALMLLDLFQCFCYFF